MITYFSKLGYDVSKFQNRLTNPTTQNISEIAASDIQSAVRNKVADMLDKGIPVTPQVVDKLLKEQTESIYTEEFDSSDFIDTEELSKIFARREPEKDLREISEGDLEELSIDENNRFLPTTRATQTGSGYGGCCPMCSGSGGGFGGCCQYCSGSGVMAGALRKCPKKSKRTTKRVCVTPGNRIVNKKAGRKNCPKGSTKSRTRVCARRTKKGTLMRVRSNKRTPPQLKEWQVFFSNYRDMHPDMGYRTAQKKASKEYKS